jgi:hypothetical protein
VEVFSADLSAATDEIRTQLLRQVSASRNVPYELVSGGTLSGTPIQNGTLMGIPCSWVALSEIHLRAILDMFDGVGMNHLLTTFYIKGDDLIALWAKCRIRRYKLELEARTGMPLNDDKSFVAATRGLFCEKAYELRRVGDEWVLQRDKYSVSLRALASSSLNWSKPGDTLYRTSMPGNLTAVPYLLTRYSAIGHTRAAKLCKLVTYRLRRRAVEQGIEPFLPLELGGLGLIPAKSTYRYKPYLAAALTGMHNLVPECVDFFRSRYRESLPRGSIERVTADRMKPVTLHLVPTWDQEDNMVILTERLLGLLMQSGAAMAVAEGCKPSGFPGLKGSFRFLRNSDRAMRKIHPMREPPVVNWNHAMRLAKVRWHLSYEGLGDFPFREYYPKAFGPQDDDFIDPEWNSTSEW